ncbi:hypothetical protein VNO78_24896 [Psophocarpus tetragonolobus]|uniref:Uncharacterized protein n=1 Tax=Psophocarpus tetragonolobus TaxID=3891 RepID=A0AAN9S5J6_PSOTE
MPSKLQWSNDLTITCNEKMQDILKRNSTTCMKQGNLDKMVKQLNIGRYTKNWTEERNEEGEIIRRAMQERERWTNARN